jgi:hypothetical protein
MMSHALLLFPATACQSAPLPNLHMSPRRAMRYPWSAHKARVNPPLGALRLACVCLKDDAVSASAVRPCLTR